jgi:sulfane dehydrogenase subunit SoxC
VKRRSVEWLTADPISRSTSRRCMNWTGSSPRTGCALNATTPELPRSIRPSYRLMINGLVDRELVFTMQDLMRFPRENRTYFLECAANSGMEWRGAQLNGCQFTHGMIHNVMYTGVHAEIPTGRTAGLKPSAKWLLVEGRMRPRWRGLCRWKRHWTTASWPSG